MSDKVDISNKGLSDTHTMNISQLIKTYAGFGVKSIDMSGNKISDMGIQVIIKALCDT